MKPSPHAPDQDDDDGDEESAPRSTGHQKLVFQACCGQAFLTKAAYNGHLTADAHTE